MISVLNATIWKPRLFLVTAARHKQNLTPLKKHVVHNTRLSRSGISRPAMEPGPAKYHGIGDYLGHPGDYCRYLAFRFSEHRQGETVV